MMSQKEISGVVLFVDDEEGVCKLARRSLERAGYQVVVAENGGTAQDLFQKHVQDLVAVILDLTLPDMTGREIFHSLQSAAPEVPVILSSGYPEEEIQKEFAQDETAGFLQKPYSPTRLISSVQQWARSPRPL